MRKTVIFLVVAILAISAFPTIAFAAPPEGSLPDSSSSQEQILVKFQPNVGLPEAAQIHRQLGGQVKETIPGIGVQVVTVPKGQGISKAKVYSANAGVAYAEPDFVAEAMDNPDDPYLGLQWGLTRIEATQAWDVTTGSENINIAILDTGVDLDHPDLANKVISNINFSTSPTLDDVYGHGTHVAGIAAAITGNGIGVTGLGYDATIMNVKVLGDTGSGTYSAIVAGIIWAVDNGAEIINMSLGGYAAASTLEDAVNYAWSNGVVVVAAAGNSGSTTLSYPAYYENCIAVAATDVNDTLASFSTYGKWVDVAAPGLSIYSTLRNNGYGYMSGTSMASPHVAGLASLVFTTVSDINGDGKLNDEVRNRIETTCDDIAIPESRLCYGRINAARAVGSNPVSPGTITGQVTDAQDGSFLAGAVVTDGIRTAVTGVSGEYTIADVPAGSYEVTASKDGYESSSLMVTVLEGNTAVADLSLVRIILPGSITGTITDAGDGLPLSGAVVTDGTRTTTTDTSGQYSIADVPAGTYQVTASKSGYESSYSTVTVTEGNNAVVNLSLVRVTLPGTITGTITDAGDGLPVSGAVVTDGTRTGITDASGEYTLTDVPAGTYQVTASKSDYESSTSSVTVISGTTSVKDFSLNKEVPVTNTMWVDSIDFVNNGKNLFIEISIMTASGGLSGAEIGLSLECNNGEIWNFIDTTNNFGSVKFKLGKAPVGSYVAIVNSLTCSGFTWDTSKGVTAVSYALSG